jgi:hypothetical protein
VLITNEFHEFYWSTITGTLDDEKTPYGPKSIHILIISKTRGVHGQYDTKRRRGTRPRPRWPKVGLAGWPGPGVFPKTVFTTCQSKLVRVVSNVGKAAERLNVAARPSFMAGRPDKWASHAQSSARALPYSSYKYLSAPPSRRCEESVSLAFKVLPSLVLVE